MRSNSISLLFFLFIVSLVIQGCAKDEDFTENIDGITNVTEGNGNPTSGGSTLTGLGHEVVFDWTELLLELERYAGGMRPNASARALAYIYLAAYETAVPGMRNHISNTERLNGFNLDDNERGREINWELALNSCFAEVIDHFLLNVPADRKSAIQTFYEEQQESLSADLPTETVEDSKRWGDYVARQVISYSETDESAEEQIINPQPTSYEPPTGEGFWTYSADPERALFPYWKAVRTFVIAPGETSSVPPIAYSEDPSSPYFEQMAEVYTVNDDAREEDGEQLWIAEFWSDDVENLMMSPPARQLAIAKQLLAQYDLNLQDALKLYLKLGFALNDAAVSTWKYKYDYMVMRPNVYIHEFIDPDFQTNLYRLIYWPNPSFPGYPSGHSCFASAAGGVFIDFFGNQTNFTDRSHEGRTEFRGTPRSFTSFAAMAEENAFSRIPLGVHIRMDCTEGLRLGYEISDAVNELSLTRRPR